MLIARHAHADWPAWQGSDFDRPLTSRGEQEARRAGAAMRAAGHRPVQVLASAALRTRQTAQLIAGELLLPAEALHFDESLYNASAAVLEVQLREAAAGAAGMLLLVAHNPGISQLAQMLAPGSPVFAPADWRVVQLG